MCAQGCFTPAMVHVPSHSRQRQVVVTVMTLARVSMIRPLHNGQTVGRATVWLDRESGMSFFPCLSGSHRERMGRPIKLVPMLAAPGFFGCSRVNSRHQSAPLGSRRPPE